MQKSTPDNLLSHRTLFCANLIQENDIKNKQILDIGSSESYWMSKFLIKKKAKKVIAIDPAIKKEITRSNFISYKADIFDKRLDNLKFDTAVMFDVIEHIPVGTELRAIERIYFLLKNRGKFYLTTPNNHWLMNILDPAWYLGHRHYTLEELEIFFKKNKFKIIAKGTTGGFWEAVRVLYLYIQKHLLRKTNYSFPKWLWEKSSKEFLSEGIMTNWIIAERR